MELEKRVAEDFYIKLPYDKDGWNKLKPRSRPPDELCSCLLRFWNHEIDKEVWYQYITLEGDRSEDRWGVVYYPSCKTIHMCHGGDGKLVLNVEGDKDWVFVPSNYQTARFFGVTKKYRLYHGETLE
jgi:hypothetical protein